MKLKGSHLEVTEGEDEAEGSHLEAQVEPLAASD
jgi:hypothetical protein